MSAYLNHSQALEYVKLEAGLSRATFDQSVRPRLRERKHSDRVVLYSRLAIDAALDDPSFEEGGNMPIRRTVEVALDHTYNVLWALQKGARSQQDHMKQIKKDIGSVRLRKLDYNKLEEWAIQMRARKLAESTIERRLGMVRKALRIAQTKGWVKEIPDKPETVINNTRRRWFSREEVESLIAHARVGRYKGTASSRLMPHIIGFYVDTGARRSELINLRREHIMSDGVLFVDRKAGGDIRVPLTTRARTAANLLLDDEWWIARRGNVKSLGDWIGREFSRIANRAKVDDGSIHTLRHTCGSWLAQGGMDLLKIQKWLGHTKVEMTASRYAHLRPSDLLGGVSILEVQENDNVVSLHNERV